jgi:hypothetical protein
MLKGVSCTYAHIKSGSSLLHLTVHDIFTIYPSHIPSRSPRNFYVSPCQADPLLFSCTSSFRIVPVSTLALVGHHSPSPAPPASSNPSQCSCQQHQQCHNHGQGARRQHQGAAITTRKTIYRNTCYSFLVWADNCSRYKK